MEKTKDPRPRRKKNQYTGIYLMFWVIIIGLSVILIVGQARQYNEYREAYERVIADIARVRAENEDLQRQLEFYDSDAHIEQLARERLGMVRPNEIVFRNIAAE